MYYSFKKNSNNSRPDFFSEDIPVCSMFMLTTRFVTPILALSFEIKYLQSTAK